MNKLHLHTYPCSLEYEKTPHLLQRRVWRDATRLHAVSKQLLRQNFIGACGELAIRRAHVAVTYKISTPRRA